MTKLHTFGCSITQGYALPDVVKPIVDENGQPLTEKQLDELGDDFDWDKVHLYQPSDYAWPKVLGDKLGIPVINHARRGACFSQISRQCAMAASDIYPEDIVIVMWTYLSRISLQWPARTSVPFCNIADPTWAFKTVIYGFNKLFGLERSDKSNKDKDKHIQNYIENSTKNTYLNPMGVYDRYYNNLVLQQMTAGFLAASGAKTLHLSVETESSFDQLEAARKELDLSLREPYKIPHPKEWHTIPVDHDSCRIILDPDIPPAENDMHPSVQHHQNFAEHIYKRYFNQ